MKRDIIAELNREQDRRLLWPPVIYFILPFLMIAAIILVYAYSREIDKFASSYPLEMAGLCVGLSVFGLWRLSRLFYW